MFIRKRILSIVMAVACVSTLSSFNVSAEPTNGNYLVEMDSVCGEIAGDELDGITPYDNSYPTETWNLSTNGSYSVNGSASGSADIYTLYKFKSSSGEINYTINNNNNTQSITLYRYKNGSSIFNRKKLCTITAGSTATGTISVSSTDTIFFAFSSPCNVTGTITE